MRRTWLLGLLLLAGCATVVPGGFVFREYREDTPAGTLRLFVSDAETVFDFCSGASGRPRTACATRQGQDCLVWVPERRYDLVAHEVAHCLWGDWHD